jgi:hypothetical protein
MGLTMGCNSMAFAVRPPGKAIPAKTAPIIIIRITAVIRGIDNG